MDHNQRSRRIVMLPWLAHGHISPFLKLAKSLISKTNFVIYLCSTPVNLNSIKENVISKEDLFSLKLVELQLPSLPQLPPYYQTTNGLPPHLMPTLKQAFDMGEGSFTDILVTLKPDLVIYDFLQPWAASAASSQNIPAVVFFTTGAAASCYQYHSAWLKLSSDFPFPSIYFRNDEYIKYISRVESKSNGMSDRDRILRCVEQSSDIIFIRSSKDIEGKYIDYFSTFCKNKLIVPVGPLVGSTSTSDVTQEKEGEHKGIFEWLDKKEKKSTLFASFGSEYFLTKEDMEAIALGFKLSGVNFIWVVRFPLHENIELGKALPIGFLESMTEKGMIIEGWAPQEKILGHESIGGFVSHCGWSSVMEGIKHGVPIIGMPMQIDQPLNARLVKELGVGEEVVRDKEGKLEKEEIARVIRNVVVDRIRGEEKKKQIEELKEKMMKKGDEEIDNVVEEINKLCRKNEIKQH